MMRSLAKGRWGSRYRFSVMMLLGVLGAVMSWHSISVQAAETQAGAHDMQNQETGQRALVSPDDVAALKIREVILAHPHHGLVMSWIPPGISRDIITETMYKKYACPNWDIAKWRKYIDMLVAFGFNSIQLSDTSLSYRLAGWGDYPREWPQKVAAIADYARSRGLRTTFFIWGTVGFDYRDNTPYLKGLCWNDPREREILEQYWEHQAWHVSHFDHLVTHWGDPGGCKRGGCTIETAQHLHNEIVRRCREHNPTINSSFSLWCIDNAWPGYKDVHTVVDAGILPAEVMVAVGTDYSMDRIPGKLREVQEIATAGRKVGVWGWYLADHEMLPSLWVRTASLKDYFSKFVGQTYEQTEWHTIDSCVPPLNMHNLYVAAKLMRDPQADADAALGEFLAGAFGPPNVAALKRVFDVIHNTRGEQINWTRGGTYGKDSVPDVTVVQEVHQAVVQISIPEDFRPAFPMVISPQEFLAELAAQTEVMVEFLEFSAAAAQVEEMKKEGKPEEEINAAIADLPQVAAPSQWLTTLEYCLYLQKLGELKK